MAGGDGFIAEANSFDFTARGGDFGYGGVEFDVDTGILKVAVEDTDDVFCGLVNGEDSAVFASVDLEPSIGEHFDDLLVSESKAGRADKVGFVFSKGFKDRIDGAVMCDIAFAAARDEDFCTDSVGFFDEEHVRTIHCGFVAGNNSGGPGPDDDERSFHG